MRTLRNALLAGCAALSLSATTPANALLGVGDIVFDPAVHAELMSQLAVAKDMLDNGREALGVAKKAYDAANAVSGLANGAGSGWPSVLPCGGTMAGLLNGGGDLGQATAGTLGSGCGLLGDVFNFTRPGYSNPAAFIGEAVGFFLQRDRIYEVPGQDWEAQEMNRRRRAIAGRMGMQQGVYEQIDARFAALEELRLSAVLAVTEAEKQDVANRYREEQTKIAALNLQVANMRSRAAEEELNTAQRRAEKHRMDLDAAYDALLAARNSRFGGGPQLVAARVAAGP